MLKMLTLFVLALMTAGAVYAGDCGSGCSGDCCTEPTIKVWGQNRLRLNIEDLSFAADVDPVWFTESRTRIGIAGYKSENAGVKFELQDSRILGQAPGSLAYNNGTGRYETGVHQAYFWYKPCDKGWLKGGRFEVALHNERLIGSDDWDNTGRTFEGLMAGRNLNENVSLALMALQVRETFNGNVDGDGDVLGDPMVYGANVNFAEQGVDVFAIMVNDPGMVVWGNDINFSLWTFGAYSERTFGNGFWYDAMFAMQSGSDDGNVDASGMLLYAKLAKKLDNGMKLGLGVDYTTGDDPDTADKVETFNNLFYSHHRFRGMADQFVMQPAAGLMDLNAFASYPVNESWKLGGAFHLFKSVQDLNANGDKNYGNEIDLYAKYYNGPFHWKTGFTTVSWDEDGTGITESGSWIFSQATIDF